MSFKVLCLWWFFMSLPQAQLPQGFIKKKKKAFSAAYIEAICQPLKTGISHNILPYLTSLFITLILKVEECMMKIIFNKLPLPVSEFDSNPQFFSTCTTDKPGIWTVRPINIVRWFPDPETLGRIDFGNEIRHKQCINSAPQFPQNTGYFLASLALFNFLSFKQPFKNYTVLTVKLWINNMTPPTL